jgi:hypothetical protein
MYTVVATVQIVHSGFDPRNHIMYGCVGSNGGYEYEGFVVRLQSENIDCNSSYEHEYL